MKIILAITGASGSIYAETFIKKVAHLSDVQECVILYTQNGKAVWEYELKSLPNFEHIPNVRMGDNSNMFDACASGSAAYDSMVILPCSMGTLGRIASGVSGDLITRAADVMLKEKRPLILVPREAPLSAIHLNNMLTLNNAGALIMPASPFFYHKPESIEELTDAFVERVMDKTGLSNAMFRWG